MLIGGSGSAVAVRVPLHRLPEPDEWIDEIESLIYDQFFDEVDLLD